MNSTYLEILCTNFVCSFHESSVKFYYSIFHWQGDNKYWLNAYFDTANSRLSCYTPIGNCGDKVKWYDGTVFEMSIYMEIEFKGLARCISYEKNEDKFKDSGCNSKKFSVCQLTCCKQFFVLETFWQLIHSILHSWTNNGMLCSRICSKCWTWLLYPILWMVHSRSWWFCYVSIFSE